MNICLIPTSITHAQFHGQNYGEAMLADAIKIEQITYLVENVVNEFLASTAVDSSLQRYTVLRAVMSTLCVQDGGRAGGATVRVSDQGIDTRQTHASLDSPTDLDPHLRHLQTDSIHSHAKSS